MFPVHHSPGGHLGLAVSARRPGPPAVQQPPGGHRTHSTHYSTFHHLRPLDTGKCQLPGSCSCSSRSWEHWLTPHQCHLLFLPPRVRTPWALPLECPFSYLHVQAENGKSPPGHLLSRLCSPSVRTQPATEMPELGWGWAGSGSGPSVVQEKTQTWAVQATSKMEHI